MGLSFYSPPPRPANERDRQRAVDSSGVLRAPPDPALHAIVAAAARAFGTPMSAVSIIDCDRQWFAARIGLTLPETSRAISFCAHAILSPDELMVVEDAAEDDRFAGNPLVLGDPHVRFYAGVPILDRHGLPLGALCVLDSAPQRFGAPAREKLVALGARAREAIADFVG